jgi:hypothetical protein
LEGIMTGLSSAHQVDPGLRLRVCREYQDLPGLRLTDAQAARLLAITQGEGHLLLDDLVDCGFLRRSGAHYVRAEP